MVGGLSSSSIISRTPYSAFEEKIIGAKSYHRGRFSPVGRTGPRGHRSGLDPV